MNTATLSLGRCTKDACPRCDIGYIISNYITPLMQCLTNDIKDFNMQLLTTKCLNTAVMIMFFMLGSRGLQSANHCDSRAVIDRHTTGKDDNQEVLNKMRKQILHKKCKHRYLYYILMNDHTFPYADGRPDAFFPGHVFILEKIPGDPLPMYYLYQSYINQYDLKGHLERNKNTLRLSYSEVQALMAKISYIVQRGEWDQTCVSYWKDFTFVDTSNILGSQTQGRLFICCATSKVRGCIENIERYVSKKVKHLESERMGNYAHVYGNATLYHKTQQPLSNLQMQVQLQQLLRLLRKHRNNL